MTFIASKVLGGLLQPSNLILICLVLGGILVWTRWRRAGRLLMAFAIAAFVVVATVPIGGWLLVKLETRFPTLDPLPDRVDGIIMLGGSTAPEATQRWRQPSLNAAADRITAFMTLARRYPDAQLVFTGGSPSLTPQAWREADDVRWLFDDLGFDSGRVLFERESRNTVENAQFVRSLVNPRAGSRWLLVTSATHMPRAVGCFRVAGWSEIIAYPVDYRTLGRLSLMPRLDSAFSVRLRALDEAVHEWAGLIAYRLLGRTPAFFPAP